MTLQTKKYAVKKKKWMMYPVPQEFINIFSLLSKNLKKTFTYITITGVFNTVT